MNGVKIETGDDFKELFESDPGLAMGLLFDTIKDTQNKVECRFTDCQAQFITRRQVKYVIGLVLMFLAGLGVLNWQLVKTVLAYLPK